MGKNPEECSYIAQSNNSYNFFLVLVEDVILIVNVWATDRLRFRCDKLLLFFFSPYRLGRVSHGVLILVGF